MARSLLMAAILLIFSPLVQAQCLGGSPFTIMPGQSAIAGGQYTNGFLIAPPHYYQPLNYYAPNTFISQPRVVPCTPGFRTGVVPFHHGLQMPNQNPWAAALPSLIGGAGELTNLLFRSDNEAPDYETFGARREAELDRNRPRSSRASSTPSGPERQTRSLEFESRFVELPRSNTAGNLGSGGVEAPAIVDMARSVQASSPSETETETETVSESGPNEDFIGPPAPPVSPRADLDLDNPPLTDRTATDSPPSILGTDFAPRPPSLSVNEDQPPTLVPTQDQPIIAPTLPELRSTASLVEDALNDLPNIGLPPSSDCLVDETPTLASLPRLVRGAFRVMQTFYQSCEVTDIVLDQQTPVNIQVLDEVISSRDETRRALTTDNRNRFIEHHPILRQLQRTDYPAPQCQNILESPSMFSYGAKPRLNRNQAGVSIDLFQNQAQRCPSSHVECDSLPVIAMDCSGFIQAAMVASGHRIFPDQRDNQERGTSGFLNAALNPESCLRAATFEKQENSVETLKPGDLITLHAHHMYMITDVGPDPLGIQRALDRGDCDSLDMNEFDFKFIQSGAAGSIGVARMSANSPHHSEIIRARLYYQAKKTCFEMQNDQPLSPPIEQSARRTEFMVIRHLGNQRPECLAAPERIRLQGQECLENCERIE
jgi:hypothetical protein